MNRMEDSPPRVIETNIDFPALSVNGDLNKGSNGNNRAATIPEETDDHDMETPQATDIMLSGDTKLPLHPLHHHHHHHHPMHHHHHPLHHHHRHRSNNEEEEEDEEDAIAMKKRKPSRLDKMADRHGLTRKGVVLLMLAFVVCVLLVVALLVMVALWPRDLLEEKLEICLTPDCLRASAQLQGNINPESAPCQDFWGFSCGGWLQDNPIPPTRSKWSVAEKLRHQALSEMRELLDTMDEPEDVNSIEWKLKTFYWSCMNIRPYMNTGLILLKRKIISELHGWNLMRETWDIRRWEFEVVLTKLHANYGISPFFKVTVVPDPRREGHNIIKLLPSGFSMPHRSYYDRLPNNEVEQAYKQYIKDTVKLFEASGPDAIEFATHLFHYESRIAEITPSEAALKDPNSSNVVISIGELTQIARSVPWLDLLRNLFPNSKLDHRTDILVVSREYFVDLSTLISTTDRSLLNNYLIFSFVTAFMPYLSDDDKRVLDLYIKEFTGTHEPRERWEFCIESTNKFMGFGLGSLYERSPSRLKARRKNIEVITAMFNQIRNTLGSNLAYSRWYPIVTRAQLTAKLNNMSIAVGYPDSLIDPEIINKYFQEYTIFTKDFFKNLFDSIHNSQKHLELKLIDPMPEASWMDALSRDSITYLHEANKIVIPPHLLNPPLFHRNYPKAMLYGSMGVRIAREMLRSMGSIGLAWNSRGQLVERNLDMNRTLENLQAVSDCVSDATKKLAVEEDAVVDRTAPDTAAEVDAIRQTYQAYVNLMKYEHQPQHPSFEHLNTTNIFFMAYAGSMCLDATPEQEDIDRTCSSALLNKPKLESVLAQLPEFRQVFSCSPDSKHFAKRPCAQLH